MPFSYSTYECATPTATDQTDNGFGVTAIWNVDRIASGPDTIEDIDADDLDPIKILGDAGGNFGDLPIRGELYPVGTNLVCTERQVGELIRLPNQNLIRRQVTVQYEQVLLQGTNGQVITAASLNPLEWVPEVVVDGQFLSYNVSRAHFLGYYEVDFAAGVNDYNPCGPAYTPPTMQDVVNSYASMQIGKHSPVQNTAGRAFAEGIDIGKMDHKIEITKYFTDFNLQAGQCYEDKLNSSLVNLAVPGRNFTMSAEAKELWLVRIRARSQRLDKYKIDYWALTYEMVYRKGGHHIDISNVGTVRHVSPGDADGFGGTISAIDIPAGTSPVAANRGVDGFVDEDPKFLAKNGRTFLNPRNASFMRFQAKDEIDFNDAFLGLIGNGVGGT